MISGRHILSSTNKLTINNGYRPLYSVPVNSVSSSSSISLSPPHRHLSVLSMQKGLDRSNMMFSRHITTSSLGSDRPNYFQQPYFRQNIIYRSFSSDSTYDYIPVESESTINHAIDPSKDSYNLNILETDSFKLKEVVPKFPGSHAITFDRDIMVSDTGISKDKVRSIRSNDQLEREMLSNPANFDLNLFEYRTLLNPSSTSSFSVVRDEMNSFFNKYSSFSFNDFSVSSAEFSGFTSISNYSAVSSHLGTDTDISINPLPKSINVDPRQVVVPLSKMTSKHVSFLTLLNHKKQLNFSETMSNLYQDHLLVSRLENLFTFYMKQGMYEAAFNVYHLAKNNYKVIPSIQTYTEAMGYYMAIHMSELEDNSSFMFDVYKLHSLLSLDSNPVRFKNNVSTSIDMMGLNTLQSSRALGSSSCLSDNASDKFFSNSRQSSILKLSDKGPVLTTIPDINVNSVLMSEKWVTIEDLVKEDVYDSDLVVPDVDIDPNSLVSLSNLTDNTLIPNGLSVNLDTQSSFDSDFSTDNTTLSLIPSISSLVDAIASGTNTLSHVSVSVGYQAADIESKKHPKLTIVAPLDIDQGVSSIDTSETLISSSTTESGIIIDVYPSYKVYRNIDVNLARNNVDYFVQTMAPVFLNLDSNYNGFQFKKDSRSNEGLYVSPHLTSIYSADLVLPSVRPDMMQYEMVYMNKWLLHSYEYYMYMNMQTYIDQEKSRSSDTHAKSIPELVKLHSNMNFPYLLTNAFFHSHVVYNTFLETIRLQKNVNTQIYVNMLAVCYLNNWNDLAYAVGKNINSMVQTITPCFYTPPQHNVSLPPLVSHLDSSDEESNDPRVNLMNSVLSGQSTDLLFHLYKGRDLTYNFLHFDDVHHYYYQKELYETQRDVVEAYPEINVFEDESILVKLGYNSTHVFNFPTQESFMYMVGAMLPQNNHFVRLCNLRKKTLDKDSEGFFDESSDSTITSNLSSELEFDHISSMNLAYQQSFMASSYAAAALIEDSFRRSVFGLYSAKEQELLASREVSADSDAQSTVNSGESVVDKKDDTSSTSKNIFNTLEFEISKMSTFNDNFYDYRYSVLPFPHNHTLEGVDSQFYLFGNVILSDYNPLLVSGVSFETTNMLFEWLYRTGKTHEALQVVMKMILTSSKLDSLPDSSLPDSDIESLTSTLKSINENYIISTPLPCDSMLLHSLKLCHDTNNIHYLFFLIKIILSQNKLIPFSEYSDIFKTCAKFTTSGELSETVGLNLFKEMRMLYIIYQKYLNGENNQSESLISNSHSLSFPSPHLYLRALSLCTTWESALLLLMEMEANKIHVDFIHLNIILRLSLKNNRMDLHSYFRDVIRIRSLSHRSVNMSETTHFIKPQSGLYEDDADSESLLLNSFFDLSNFSAAGYYHEALAIVDRLEAEHETYIASLNRGEYDSLNYGRPPYTVTSRDYSLVMLACFNNPIPDLMFARKLFFRAFEKDLIDDIQFWTYYINCYKKVGDTAHALAIYQLLLTLNRMPLFLPLSITPNFFGGKWNHFLIDLDDSDNISFDKELRKYVVDNQTYLSPDVLTEAYQKQLKFVKDKNEIPAASDFADYYTYNPSLRNILMFDPSSNNELDVSHTDGSVHLSLDTSAGHTLGGLPIDEKNNLYVNYDKNIHNRTAQYSLQVNVLTDFKKTSLEMAAIHYQDYLYMYYSALQSNAIDIKLFPDYSQYMSPQGYFNHKPQQNFVGMPGHNFSNYLNYNPDDTTLPHLSQLLAPTILPANEYAINELHRSDYSIFNRTLINTPLIDDHFIAVCAGDVTKISPVHGMSILHYFNQSSHQQSDYLTQITKSIDDHNLAKSVKTGEPLKPFDPFILRTQLEIYSDKTKLSHFTYNKVVSELVKMKMLGSACFIYDMALNASVYSYPYLNDSMFDLNVVNINPFIAVATIRSVLHHIYLTSEGNFDAYNYNMTIFTGTSDSPNTDLQDTLLSNIPSFVSDLPKDCLPYVLYTNGVNQGQVIIPSQFIMFMLQNYISDPVINAFMLSNYIAYRTFSSVTSYFDIMTEHSLANTLIVSYDTDGNPSDRQEADEAMLKTLNQPITSQQKHLKTYLKDEVNLVETQRDLHYRNPVMSIAQCLRVSSSDASASNWVSPHSQVWYSERSNSSAHVLSAKPLFRKSRQEFLRQKNHYYLSGPKFSEFLSNAKGSYYDYRRYLDIQLNVMTEVSYQNIDNIKFVKEKHNQEAVKRKYNKLVSAGDIIVNRSNPHTLFSSANANLYEEMYNALLKRYAMFKYRKQYTDFGKDYADEQYQKQNEMAEKSVVLENVSFIDGILHVQAGDVVYNKDYPLYMNYPGKAIKPIYFTTAEALSESERPTQNNLQRNPRYNSSSSRQHKPSTSSNTKSVKYPKQVKKTLTPEEIEITKQKAKEKAALREAKIKQKYEQQLANESK